MRASASIDSERNFDLFARQTQLQLSSTFLQPSSTLGSRKILTNQELQENAESKLVRRALEGRTGGKRRRDGIDEPMDSDDPDDGIAEPDGSRQSPVIIPNDEENEGPETVQDGPVIREIGGVGSALRRNADGTVPAVNHVGMQKKVSSYLKLLNTQF